MGKEPCNPLRRLWDRLGWLAVVMPSPCSFLRAFFALILVRRSAVSFAVGKYKGLSFCFRQRDLSALKEVLVDLEYDFLADIVRNKAGQQQPVILDCVAHIGTFSLWCLGVNSAANIISFEAAPDTFGLLKQTIAKNKIATWKGYHAALWSDCSSVLRFCSGSQDDSMGYHVSDDGDVQVPTLDLSGVFDELADDSARVDLMKIDIEGAEEEFICKGDHAHLSRVDNLVIELHPKRCDTDKVLKILRQYFNTVETVNGRISGKPLMFCHGSIEIRNEQEQKGGE